MQGLVKIRPWTQLENLCLFPDKKVNVLNDTFSPKASFILYPKSYRLLLSSRTEGSKTMAYEFATYFCFVFLF